MKEKYDYNKNRNRKRFKVMWIGPKDTDGFVTEGRLYTVTEVKASGHFVFINNFGVSDMALATYFKVVRGPRENLTKPIGFSKVKV